ncbi:MAG TPA: hypothetical protein DET40_09650 [Lentisphaeria bacterium]|nr:MAG: hypothetical protein A2X45_08435 [Lentisphaerae bacterium GWF2_50_93]HCE43798.1 hypothetical protein [Lentisphaeria bacterium]
MNKFLASLSAGAVFIGTFSLLADDASKTTPAAPNTFKKIDKDSDGKITPDEYNSYWIDIFEVIDIDKNGRITEPEMKARAEKRVAEIDRNKDDGVARHEFITLPKPAEGKAPEKAGSGKTRFAQADVNADGSITLQEYHFILGDQFDKADKSKDGKIDKVEATDMLMEIYRMSDIDKDGIVTKDEWLAYWVGTLPKEEKKADK